MSILEEAHDSGGRRYYLDDEPLACGVLLEVHLQGGWLPVRFEMDGQQFPVFYLRLGNGDQIPLRLPDNAELRRSEQGLRPVETEVRKLRFVLTQLHDIVDHPGDYDGYERKSAARHAQNVLRATAPRLPEEV